jgi:hypothetical protein
MLPRDPLALTPVLAPSPATAADPLGSPRQQAFQRALATQLGQSLQGQVLARLSDGSFLVRVAETPARMLLPPGTQAGTELPMKLVTLQPRPTFQVGAGFAEAGPEPADGAVGEPLAFHEQGATARALARTAALLGGSGAAGLDHAGERGGDEASLSPAGRLLGSVLAAASKDGQPAAVAGHAPLLAAPGADPAALAHGLQRALSASGLFYEAHVAEWAQGRRPLDALAAEPQMATRPASPLEPAAAGLINQQLAAQEQARVAWHGELWPGQPLRWEVERRGSDGQPAGHGQDDAQPVWQSRLALRFPLLGDLSASVTLSGGAVRVQLDAAPQAAELLRRHAPRLSGAFEAAGTPLAGLAIRGVGAHDDA